MNYTKKHLNEAIEILNKIDVDVIEKMADLLVVIKQTGGRIFFLGVGGSAGNCSHAVNDFRKIAGIESYAPMFLNLQHEPMMRAGHQFLSNGLKPVNFVRRIWYLFCRLVVVIMRKTLVRI
jgi:hypothetical protein